MDDITEENIEDRLIEWSEKKHLLTSIKSEEMDMRVALVNYLSGWAGLGTYRRGFNTFIAKAKIGINYKIDEEKLAIHIDDLTIMESNAIRYKPNLSITNYKKIPETMRETLDECLVVTPAAPTLNVDYRGPENVS